jgi:hypothetical protein
VVELAVSDVEPVPTSRLGRLTSRIALRRVARAERAVRRPVDEIRDVPGGGTHVPAAEQLEIADAYEAVGRAVGKVVGLAVDGCYSHKAAHGGDGKTAGSIFARFPGGSTDLAPPTDLEELEDVTGPLVVDCPASFTKQDGQVVVVVRSNYDQCIVEASRVVRIVAGEPYSDTGNPHEVTPDPALIDASDRAITVTMQQGTSSTFQRPAHGVYLGTVQGHAQGQTTDRRHVVIYVHGVDLH